MFSQIAAERQLPDACLTVAEISNKLICDVDELTQIIKTHPDEPSRMDLFNVDVHFPGSENKTLAVVLYGELGTADFARFHSVLRDFAQVGRIDYVVRHYVKSRPNRKLRLSGYGVELQMKSTEYKVQDDAQVKDEAESAEASQEEDEVELEGFNFARLKELYPDLKGGLQKFKKHLEETSNEMAPLKVWQFQELSLQSAERIMNAPKEEVLNVFTNTAQNFPMQAKSLVSTVVKPELKKEMLRNQELFASILNLQPSDTGLFINGLFHDIDVVDIFGIMDVVRQEMRTMSGLHGIGIKGKLLSSLLALDFSDASTQEFAMDIRDSAINWINDLEHDSKYMRWSSSVMEFLRPTFPGMLRQIRRNLFNLVVIIDPTNVDVGLLKLLESFVMHMVPLRVGLVFSVNPTTGVTGLQDASVAVLCAFNYVSQVKTSRAALTFLNNVSSIFYFC